MRRLLLALVLSLLAATPATAQIANSHPNDNGICSNPAVVFCEMFEDTTIGPVLQRWTGSSTVSDTFVTSTTGQSQASSQMSTVVDGPPGSNGTRALRTRATGGSFTQLQLSRSLETNCPAPCNELYFRWYVKYPSVLPTHHAGIWVLGQNPKSSFLPSTNCSQSAPANDPSSCTRLLAGDTVFYIGTEPGSGSQPPESIDTYTGWMAMHQAPDNCCGDFPYVGNTFLPNSFTITPGVWHYIELRVKMNNPTTDFNGEMQLWFDGPELMNLVQGSPTGSWTFNTFTPGSGVPFEGFRWRSTSALELSKILLNHVSTFLSQGLVQDILWDHVVVATQRVGPIATSTDTIPPTDPTLLRTTALSSSSITTAWNASTDTPPGSVNNYRYEGCTGVGCSNFTELSTSPTNSFTESNLAANTTYLRRVRAWDGTNFSGYSNTITVTTLPLQTWFIRFTDAQADGANQETGFTVQRSVPGGAFSTIATPGASAGSGTQITVQDTTAPRPTACYQVCAQNALGCSSFLGGPSGVCGTNAAGTLGVSTSTLTFNAQVGAGNPASQALTIQNLTGTGMTWTVSDNANWLSVTPQSGTDTTQVTVAVNHTNCATDCPLPAATHNAIITIAAPGAVNNPTTVSVTLNLAPAGSPGGTTPGTARGGRVR